MNRPIESDYTSQVAYTRALEEYCNALEQPAQEPTAWITPDGEGFRIRFSAPTSDVPLGWEALYTTPPKRPWVGLTGTEKHDLRYSHMTSAEFIDAIEAKLKEKNFD